jgi:hypothetical protein
MRKSLIEARRKHDKYLRKMGVHPDQRRERLSEDNKFKPISVGHSSIPYSSTKPSPSTFAPCPKKTPNVYSGERRLLGIACMHKSNLVPIFEKKDLVEIGKMRR